MRKIKDVSTEPPAFQAGFNIGYAEAVGVFTSIFKDNLNRTQGSDMKTMEIAVMIDLTLQQLPDFKKYMKENNVKLT